jgi:hypothetical protein
MIVIKFTTRQRITNAHPIVAISDAFFMFTELSLTDLLLIDLYRYKCSKKISNYLILFVNNFAVACSLICDAIAKLDLWVTKIISNLPAL